MKRATLEETRQALLPDVPMTLLVQMTLGKNAPEGRHEEDRVRARMHREANVRLLHQQQLALDRERAHSPEELIDQAEAWLR